VDPDEDIVRYHITLNPSTCSVRLDVSGFNTEEDARAFADWLSNIPFDDDPIDNVVH
jgi:hypothetical protein